jgi:hypothetical protein
MEKIWIQDPGWKKFGSGIKIPNPQHSKGLKSLQLMTEINNGLNQTCRFRAEAPSVPSMFVISKEGMVITYRGKETMQKENFTSFLIFLYILLMIPHWEYYLCAKVFDL